MVTTCTWNTINETTALTHSPIDAGLKAPRDATTRAVLDLLVPGPDFRKGNSLPPLVVTDRWKDLNHSHIIAILRRATHGLFLRSDNFIVQRHGYRMREDSRMETARWHEDWIIQKLGPYRRWDAARILAAARSGEFKYLANACHKDLLNAIEKCNRPKRGRDVVQVDYNDDLHAKPAYSEPSMVEYLPRNMGKNGVFLRVCVAVAERDGDLSLASVIEELAHELEDTPQNAANYMRSERASIKSSLPNSPLLQEIRQNLLRAIYRRSNNTEVWPARNVELQHLSGYFNDEASITANLGL